MADQKISQLTDGTSFQAGDEAVVNRSGTNFKVDPTVGVVQQTDIGTDPNQVPLNQYLGSMAYQDLENVVVGELTADGLAVDTDTLYVDAANDRVGIGTTAPTQPLTINYSDTNAAPTSSLTESDTGAIRIYNESNSAAYTGIFLSNRLSSSSHALIGLRYNSAFDDGDLFFKVRNGAGSSAEVLTLKASGNVGIGTTSPSQALDVVGNIEVSGGVYLGGTGAANLLDDYEEGTWTPTTAGDATGALSAQEGFYRKVGNVVHLFGQFTVSTNFTSSSIGGLPFNVANLFSISGYAGSGAAICSVNNVGVTPVEGGATVQFLLNFSVNHQPSTTGINYRFYVAYMAA